MPLCGGQQEQMQGELKGIVGPASTPSVCTPVKPETTAGGRPGALGYFGGSMGLPFLSTPSLWTTSFFLVSRQDGFVI